LKKTSGVPTEPVLSFVVSALTVLVFGAMLYWHWMLGLSRYFDADEFAHLHWAANRAGGLLPYRDFLTFFPPVFHALLAPLLVLGWGTAMPLVWGRVCAFVVFASACLALGVLLVSLREFRGVYRTLWGVCLPGLVLAFLPMPFDKFLEIRPDILAIMIGLIGLIGQIWWMKIGKRVYAFWSGFLYASAILVLTKVVPQVGVASLVAFVFSIRHKIWNQFFWFAAGLFLPIALFLGWALRFTTISVLWYDLVRLPVEANRLGNTFSMAPDLFFYPNAVFYGVGGWSRGLLFNHALWFVGIFVGIFRMVTPFHAGKGWRAWAEVLVAGMFVVSVVTFMYGFPLRHSQYLIPIAVYIALYAADGIYLARVAFDRIRSGIVIFTIVYICFLFAVFDTATLVNMPKFAWNNQQDTNSVTLLHQMIPANAYVLDLMGTSLYFRDPYPICCVPFGQWQSFMSRPLVPLFQVLESTQTKYIYEGRLDRIHDLQPSDGVYITEHFSKVSGFEGLWKRK
jgi:hypothetical protein